MSVQPGDKLFNVVDKGGTVAVVEAVVTDRRGSWITLESCGRTWKQQGPQEWSTTVMAALHLFVYMQAYQITETRDRQLQNACISRIAHALREAAEWGRLLGAVAGLDKEAADADK